MYVKNKFSFFILLFLFVGPLLGAWYLYSTGGNWSKKTVNHGTLIQPPLSFSQFSITDAVSGEAITAIQLQKKWLILYITSLPCETECQQVLYKIRQVRLTLGKDQQRVQRVLVTPATESKPSKLSLPLLKKDYVGTHHWQITSDKNKSLPSLTQGHLYLVDPLGNVFMRYPQSVTPRDLKDDLVRLLKVSRIG